MEYKTKEVYYLIRNNHEDGLTFKELKLEFNKTLDDITLKEILIELENIDKIVEEKTKKYNIYKNN